MAKRKTSQIKDKPPDAPAGEEQQIPTSQVHAGSFPIVGIGASAGGLAAFEAFFAHMPTDTESGLAFVLVQHLAPDHKSILTDLVRRYTRMQVYEVQDGIEVQPNCAYIIPPNCDMAFLDGKLHLLEPAAPRGLRLPIDFFFRSLAQDQHERAICIVLSGTGSDGTLGVQAIKGEGGMAMAQDPETTEYDGMPRSAIATGLVDYVLPPSEMPAQLIAYVEHAFGRRPRPISPPTPKAADSMQKIFILLRAQIGHDFSQYKQNTVARRVERRMAIGQIERLDEYIRFLQQAPQEVEALFRDLLIGVTSFFRDPEAFKALEQQVIPHLFDDKHPGAAVRVWVPGCSTGEEAYSIAILLQEHLQALKQSYKVQVFATDIDRQAIEQARAGTYPASIAADVPQERLARFFALEQDGSAYRIHRIIRDMLVFAEQDVTKDPPFSRLNLISCRNLLIYMGGELQNKVISLCHYALTRDGFLFLGSSETIGQFVDLFGVVDRKWKLYRRKDAGRAAPRPALGSFVPSLPDEARPSRASRPARRDGATRLRDLAERALLHQYAPASVVVNERSEILFIHGRTGKYLEPAPGEVSINILQMAREGLRRELTTALRHAAQGEPAHYQGLKIKTNGEVVTVNLTVRSLAEGWGEPAKPGMFLVTFEDAQPAADQPEATTAPDAAERVEDRDEQIVLLEQELWAKESHLQTVIEELETSNEELQSTNEEMQSANEELQSTNEELETSKEELQSINEELATVNAELQQKVHELSRANNDMNNLLAGTGVGTIFVDHQLRIRRFTPSATQVINLIQSDVGRPVGHVVSNLVGYDRLVEDVQAVLDDLIPREAEVQAKEGAWYLMSVRPYRTLENVIEGAVITFVDISEQRRMREALQESEALRRLAVVVLDSNDAVTVQDLEGHILAWNPAAERLYGWREIEALSMNIRDLVPAGLREEALDTVQKLSQTVRIEPFQTQRIAKDGQIVEVWLTATALIDARGEAYAVATTERKMEPEEEGK